jgi:SAM-dependent methyltransferase
VLDAGCGSGLFAHLIATAGCTATGLDASELLLGVARRRNPGVAYQLGDLEVLPFPDGHFDVVTGINSFQYAADLRHALVEAGRVTRWGGHVIVGTWGAPDRCESAASIAALRPLLPPQAPGAPGPFALSDESALKSLVTSVGLTWQSTATVELTWHFDDNCAALAGLLSAGPAALAIQTSGREAVSAALQRAIAPYRLANGSYRLENQFRYAIAARD